MIVLSETDAKNKIANSLFQPDEYGSLAACTKERLDRGKYKSSIIGRELQVPFIVRLVWAVKRKDRHGEYYALWCVPAPQHSKITAEKVDLARAAGYSAAAANRSRVPASCPEYGRLIEGFEVGDGGDVLARHWLAGFQTHCNEQSELVLQRSN